MHGIVYLCACMPLLVLSSHVTNIIAISDPTHHDIVPLYSEYAQFIIPCILAVSILASVITKPNTDVLCKRLALVYLLKAISQFLTISPQPNGVEHCENKPFWYFSFCADMMFSGHTAFTYLILYKCKYRYFITLFMAFELVMANWHYMVDCFIAVIVSYAVEKKIPIESYI